MYRLISTTMQTLPFKDARNGIPVSPLGVLGSLAAMAAACGWLYSLSYYVLN